MPNRTLRLHHAALALLAVVLAGACQSNTPTQLRPTPAAPTAEPPTAAAEPTEAASAATSAQAPAGQDLLRLVPAPDGNEARYLVTEQLASISFPTDAIGATRDIAGAIVLRADGTVVAEESNFVVGLDSLASDNSRRDNFIKANTLHTNQYPDAVFVPTQAVGLPTPLPSAGPVAFQLVGDMTVHGVTRPVTWDVTGEVQGDALVGRATTAFTFADFGLQAPRVPVVLSVEETIRLELDFHLVRDAAASS